MRSNRLTKQVSIRIDYLFIADYVVFLAAIALCCTLACHRTSSYKWLIVLFPLMAGLFDRIENLCLTQILAAYPARPGAWTAAVAGIAASVKFLLLLVTLLAILIVALAVARLTGRHPDDKTIKPLSFSLEEIRRIEWSYLTCRSMTRPTRSDRSPRRFARPGSTGSLRK